MGKEESGAPAAVERGVPPALGDTDGPSGRENGPEVVLLSPRRSQGTQHNFSCINFCRVINSNRAVQP